MADKERSIKRSKVGSHSGLNQSSKHSQEAMHEALYQYTSSQCASKEQRYMEDLVEIRSMMERSSRFLLVSGWAGIFAGIYALIGVYILQAWFGFRPESFVLDPMQQRIYELHQPSLILVGLVVLLVSAVTAIVFSFTQARKRGERIWTPPTKKLLEALLVPVVIGATLILILLSTTLIGFIPPFMLLFYGLGLYQAGTHSLFEVKMLGAVQLLLGILNTLFIDLGLLWWALGFGAVHILYGVYIKIRYER